LRDSSSQRLPSGWPDTDGLTSEQTCRASRTSVMIRRIIRRTLIGLALILTLLVVVTAATPQGRTAVRVLLFLPQVLPDFPIKPQVWFSRDPTRQEVTYPLASGRGVADLYVPARGNDHSAVLLFLGVNPAGRDDERVVGLAEGFARAGVVVMIPWSDTMTQKRIAVEEIDNLVMGFQYLRGLDMVDPDRVGMGGFCVGASLATVAAQDPRIRGDVEFINFFGGYFDALDLVKSVVTRSRFYGNEVEPWNPDKLSVEVVTSHLIEGIGDLDERALLTQVFVQGTVGPNIDPEKLSPEAQAVYTLLNSPAFEEVDGLLARLPAEIRDSLALISPSSRIYELQARVLIMHDREDDLVPSEESRRLAEALGPDRETYYTEFSLFQHLDPTSPVSPPVYARELYKLFLHMYNVFRELS